MIRHGARYWGPIAAALALASACGEGTAGWVLTRKASDTVGGMAGSGGGRAPLAGGSGLGASDPGASGAGGAAGDSDGPGGSFGAGGAGVVDNPRNPEDFASVCSPLVTFENRSSSGSGALFDAAFPMPEEYVVYTSRVACALLYMDPEEVPLTTDAALVVEEFEGAGEMAYSGSEVFLRLSSTHMQRVSDAGGNVHDEVAGILHFLLGLHYAHDDEDPSAMAWMALGLGDFVRLRAGYTSPAERTPGGTWTDGFKTTAFFLDWLDTTCRDAVYHLNQSLNPSDGVPWSEQVFADICDDDVSTLWARYQASL